VRSQRTECEVEVLICDSGSSDGSRELARRCGAEVIEIEPSHFSHGRTRNLLMERSRGEHVAFLTQDSIPADELWLSCLLAGFGVAPDVGLVFGPYRPRRDASPMVQRELTDWFGSFSPDGRPRIDRLESFERDTPSRMLLGRRGFFTDANGCMAREAWERTPFRDVPYAEDHVIAHDMMRAGFAKVYMPQAAVIHSHDYSAWGWLRRGFDEARSLQAVYGWSEPLHPRTLLLNIWGLVGADWRWARTRPDHLDGAVAALALLGSSAVHHIARTAGAVLGARAERLPQALVQHLSLERRAN
jgi:glycosyltransferase involved in cell wall biosynthesis